MRAPTPEQVDAYRRDGFVLIDGSHAWPASS
jgi:hypothetical protein